MPPPVRIQRKRAAGWKMPPNTKCVTRPGPFGNPFFVASSAEPHREIFRCSTSQEAVASYEATVIHDANLCALIRRELRGYNLACYCKPGEPCHADVLLRIANT